MSDLQRTAYAHVVDKCNVWTKRALILSSQSKIRKKVGDCVHMATLEYVRIGTNSNPMLAALGMNPEPGSIP
jgi:hypothetical protein